MSVKPRAVTYCRVSSNKKEQKKSIENQINAHEGYMSQYSFVSANDTGMLFYKGTKTLMQGIYADEAESGTKKKKREAFNQMIEDAKAGKFEFIVVKNIARFARNAPDLLHTLTDLKVHGVGVMFHEGKLNSLNDAQRSTIGVLAVVAEQESRSKSEAVKFGLRKSQAKGIRTTGNAPYGYNMGDGGILSINDQEAQVVKRVFDLYHNESYGLNKIARLLNREEIPTKKNAKWTAEQISKMLRRQLYNGVQIQHTVENIDINRDEVKFVPQDEWIVVQAEHLRIVDTEVFELVQIELARRAEEWGRVGLKETMIFNEQGEVVNETKRILNRNQGRNSNQHLLSNLLRCGQCGSPMHRARLRHDRENYEWICSSYLSKGTHTCRPRNAIRELHVIEELKREIAERRNNRDHFETLFSQHVCGKFDFEGANEQISKLESSIATIKAEQKTNLSLLTKGIIDEEQYAEQNKDLQATLKNFETELFGWKNLERQLDQERMKFESFLGFMDMVDVENLKNGTLKHLMKYIRVGKYEGEEYVVPLWTFLGDYEDAVIDNMAIKDMKKLGDYLGEIDLDAMTDEEFEEWDKKYRAGQLWNGKPVEQGASV